MKNGVEMRCYCGDIFVFDLEAMKVVCCAMKNFPFSLNFPFAKSDSICFVNLFIYL